MTAPTWTPQPFPVMCERDERGRWMATYPDGTTGTVLAHSRKGAELAASDERAQWPASVQLTFLPPVIRDAWSQDPDRTTRRGTC